MAPTPTSGARVEAGASPLPVPASGPEPGDAETGGAEVCAALCAVLRDGVDVHRGVAARALGRIGHGGAVAPLIDALLDEDEDVRSDAADALLRLADPRAGKPLLENLIGDPCSDVKLAAIEALARLRWPEAVPWLRRLVAGRDDAVVWDEDEYYESGWDSWTDIQIKAIEALAGMGVAEAVPEIVAAIEDEHGQDLGEAAFKALAGLGEAGITALTKFQDRADERLRRRAAAVLAGTADGAAGDAVARALRDASVEVRLAALRGVARNPSDPRLVDLFGDGDAEVRAEAVRLCGAAHPQCLEDRLDDAAESVQVAILDVLAGRPAALPGDAVAGYVESRLSAPDPRVQAAAAAALAVVVPARAGEPLARLLADAENPVEARLAAVTGLAGIGAVQPLIAALDDRAPQIRMESMAALARIAGTAPEWPNPGGDALLAALRGELVAEPESTVGGDAGQQPASARADAGRGAGDDAAADYPTSTLQSMLGGVPAAPDAAEEDEEPVVLTDEDMEFLRLARRLPAKRRVAPTAGAAAHEDVRRFAARVLGDVAHDDVARALAAELGAGDREVRLAAADSLSRIGARMASLPGEAIEALAGALDDTDRDIRLTAIRALGAAGDRTAAPAMIDLLRDEDSFVRGESVRALSSMGEAGSEIDAMLDDGDPGVRTAAAEAVAVSGGAKAVDRLVEFALSFGGDHCRAVGRLLRRLDPAAANARLIAIVNDPQRSRAWQPAIEALEELNCTRTAAA